MRASPAAAQDDGATVWLRAMPAVFVLIWSTGFIVARYAMPHAPPLTFLAWRFGASLLCFILWVRLAGATWPRGRAQWRHLAISGVLMHAGYLGGVWAAVRLGMGAATVALIVGLQPLLTALWLTAGAARPADGGAQTSRERLSRRQWGGLALGFAGLVLVVWHKLGRGEVTATNLALTLLALACITTGTLYQKRHVQPCDVRAGNAFQIGAAFVVTCVAACFEPGTMDWHPNLIGALIWSVGALTLGGSSLLYLLIQRGAATQVTSLLYLVPPCTALLAWLLFGETLGWTGLAGVLATVTGVAWVVRAPRRA